MNTAIKSAIAACGFLATAFTPLTAQADTFVFSGKDAFGHIQGMNENELMEVYAFKSGAYFYGLNYTGLECWIGYGSTDTIQFNTMGSLPHLPKQVTASGVIPVTWSEYCNSSTSPNYFTETVLFTMDLSAISNQASRNWSTSFNEYGNTKFNSHSDSSGAPAATNASSISSPALGTVTPSFGSVGQSKEHSVQIIR